jgi:hypothetical protein
MSSSSCVSGRTNLETWCVFGLIDYYYRDVSCINDSPKIFVELLEEGSVVQSQVRNSEHYDADAGVKNVSDSLFWTLVGENQSLQTLVSAVILWAKSAVRKSEEV